MIEDMLGSFGFYKDEEDHENEIFSVRRMSAHVRTKVILAGKFVTLFDLPQNTNNDKTRQLYKSK